MGSLAADPDAQDIFQLFDGKQAGGQNLSRFRLPEFDALFERMTALPDGPQRQALFDQARRLAVAYMPCKAHVHRFVSDLLHPWVLGYRRPLFWQDFWQYIDIDLERLPGP